MADFMGMMKQAAQLQSKMQALQAELDSITVDGTAGGGMVTVKATAGGEITSIAIDPKAIDPADPEMLADLVMAAANQALEAGRDLIQSKVSGALPPGLGGLLPGM